MPKLPGNFEKGPMIGRGGQKKVFENSLDKETVIKEFEHEHKASYLKGYFYLTKIMHLLFRDLVPDIHMVTKQGGREISIEDYIPHDGRHKEIMAVLMQNPIDPDINEGSTYEISQDPRIQKMRELGFDTGMIIDIMWRNFVRDSDGKLKYIEGFEPWAEKTLYRYYESKVLENAISKLAEPERTRASNYLARLEELFAQSQKETNLNI